MIDPGVARGRELPRKTLHLTTASIPLVLWYGAPQRTVAVLLLALFGVAGAVEFVRRRSTAFATQFDASVGIMLRPHEVTHGITGATWLLASFAICCLAAPLPAAIAGTWAGAVGDASAAIVGGAWRRARGGDGKTLIGSLACVVVATLGAWWLAGFALAPAIGLGVVAAAAERPAVSLDDNARVTVAVAVAAAFLLRI